MITFRNMKMSLGSELIFDNVNFSIEDHSKIGIIGVNGAGKSTLFNLIARTLFLDEGEIIFSSDVVNLSFMPQELNSDDFSRDESILEFIEKGRPIKKIRDELENKWSILSKKQSERERKALLRETSFLQEKFELLQPYTAQSELNQILKGMGLDSFDLDQSVSSLSGGEKSKVAFAKTLYSLHDILLLDEPTNHLDFSSRKWLLQFLRESKKTVLVISHDVEFLNAFSRQILFINKSRKNVEMYQGNYSSFLRQKKEKEESLARLTSKQDREEKRIKDFIQSLQGVSGKRKRQAQSREKLLEKKIATKEKQPAKLKDVRIRIIPRQESGKFPLTVDQIGFSFNQKSNFLFRKVSFSLRRSEKVAIIGQNGAGKSTFLKIIIGEIEGFEGKFELGKNVDLAYFSQEHEELALSSNVLEEFMKSTTLPKHQARSFLGRFLFQGEKVFQPVRSLSLGEKSRLCLAKIISSGANFLLLDEPTNHLDPTTKKILADALADYQGTLIVVSHEIEFLKSIGALKVVLFPSGKTTFLDQLKKVTK